MQGFSELIIQNYLSENLKHVNSSHVYLVSNRRINFFILFKNIPFRLELFFYEDGQSFIQHKDLKKKFDVIFFMLNINSIDFIEHLNLQYKRIQELLNKDVMYILVVFTSKLQDIDKETRELLISISNKLNLLYTFTLPKKNPELSTVFRQILKDFKFQFNYSSPELFERAKIYGKKMREGKTSFLELF